jgi:EmrB/QacA subfamily drug resistance transporter
MTKTRNRWIGLVFIAMSISLVIIDGTIVNTIFPNVIRALNLSSTEVQWVQESYVLVFASLLLVFGSLADRFGRKRILVIGIAIFVISSVWAGISQDASSMIAARVLQGVGGSMVLPTTLSLVNANFQGKERGIAFAVWGATIGGMVAIGPVLGGWLAGIDFKGFDLGSFHVPEGGWRLAFDINLPLGLIVIAGLLYWVSESKQAQRAGGIDFVGAVISTIMFLTLVFGLIEGRIYGWWEQTSTQFQIGDFKWATDGISIIPVSLGISVVTFVIFYLWERAREKAHKNVLLDLNLFKIASFRNGSIAALIISMGEFGLLFAIPLWLQNVLGLSPIDSGLVLLFLAGGAFLASGAAGALSGKVAAATVVRIGVLLELVAVGTVALFANAEVGWISIAPSLFIYGIGVGMATAQLTGVIMVDVPPAMSGQGSGTQSTARQVGSALGIAVLGTMLFTGTQGSIDARLAELKVPSEQATQISKVVVDSAGSAIPFLKDQLVAQHVPAATADKIVTAAGDGFTEGTKFSAWAAAGFLGLGFLSTFRLGSRKRKE